MQKRNLIPPVEGPKIGPFPLANASIDSIELLSPLSATVDSNPKTSQHYDESSSIGGGHANVVRARIGKREYAVKVFKFVDVSHLRTTTITENRFVDNRTLIYHSDPFLAECRAYGKIEELQQQRQAARQKRWKGPRGRKRVAPIAVRCFGYLEIPANRESEMAAWFGTDSWDRPAWDLNRPLEQRLPFRALVKALAMDSQPIRRPRRMLNDLEMLRAHGIYVQDIAARNYIGGLLVDFSLAWTQPHWCLQHLKEPALSMEKDGDLAMFDDMMEEAKVRTQVRAVPDAGTSQTPKSKEPKGMSRLLRPRKHELSRLRPRK